MISDNKSYEKMDARAKEKWLAALRSGNYRKGRYSLYNSADSSYCCLGVLCEISGVKKVGDVFQLRTDFQEYDKNFEAYVTSNVTKPINLTVNVQNMLTYLNDTFYSNDTNFNHIADWIEENI